MLFGCLGLMACGRTRYVVPQSGPALPCFAFAGLQSGPSFRVEVVDHRSERPDSTALTESRCASSATARTSSRGIGRNARSWWLSSSGRASLPSPSGPTASAWNGPPHLGVNSADRAGGAVGFAYALEVDVPSGLGQS